MNGATQLPGDRPPFDTCAACEMRGTCRSMRHCARPPQVTTNAVFAWPPGSRCWHERATKTIGPTTDQINRYCPDCGLSETTFPDRGIAAASEAKR